MSLKDGTENNFISVPNPEGMPCRGFIFSCGGEAPATLVEADSSFFLSETNRGLNSHNKHDFICNLGHKFQI